MLTCTRTKPWFGKGPFPIYHEAAWMTDAIFVAQEGRSVHLFHCWSCGSCWYFVGLHKLCFARPALAYRNGEHYNPIHSAKV